MVGVGSRLEWRGVGGCSKQRGDFGALIIEAKRL